jgi:DNA-binding beta-propeller fold protein YncE
VIHLVLLLSIIRLVIPLPVVVEELGRFGGTGGAPGFFNGPSGIDLSEDGRLFVADRRNHRIQVFDQFGNFLTNFGGYGIGDENFDEPCDVWARSTINIFIADYNNQRVQRYNKNLTYLSSLYSNPGEDERFQHERILSVAFSPQGEMFLLDAGENKVVKINQIDKGIAAFGYYRSGAGQLTSPIQIDLTGNHRVIVSDAGARKIFIYDFFGNFLRTIDNPDFGAPAGLAVDDRNRIYVADPVAQRVFIFDLDGNFLAEFGSAGGETFNRPVDLTLLKKDNFYQMYLIDGDTIRIIKLQISEPRE